MKVSFLNQYLLFRKQLVMKSHFVVGNHKTSENVKKLCQGFKIHFTYGPGQNSGLSSDTSSLQSRLHFGQKNCPPEFNSLPLNKCHNVTPNAMNLMSRT